MRGFTASASLSPQDPRGVETFTVAAGVWLEALVTGAVVVVGGGWCSGECRLDVRQRASERVGLWARELGQQRCEALVQQRLRGDEGPGAARRQRLIPTLGAERRMSG
jgi:hypothetical protein